MSSQIHKKTPTERVDGWMCYLCYPESEEILDLDELKEHGLTEHDLPASKINSFVHKSHWRDLEQEELDRADALEVFASRRPTVGYKRLPMVIPDVESNSNNNNDQDDQNTFHTSPSQVTHSKHAPTANSEMVYDSEDDYPTPIRENTGGKTIADAPSKTHSVVYNSDDEEQKEQEDNADIDESLEGQDYEELNHEPDHPRFGGKQPRVYVAPIVDNVEPGRRTYGGKHPSLWVPGFSYPREFFGFSEGDEEDVGAMNSQGSQEHSSSELESSFEDTESALEPPAKRKKRSATSLSSTDTRKYKKAKTSTSSQSSMTDQDQNSTSEDETEADDGNDSDSNATQPESVPASKPTKVKATNKIKTGGATAAIIPMPAGTAAFPNMKCDACRTKQTQKECQFTRFGQSCRQCQHHGASCKINNQSMSGVVWPAWKSNNPTIVNQAAYDTVAPVYSEADPGDRKRKSTRKGQ